MIATTKYEKLNSTSLGTLLLHAGHKEKASLYWKIRRGEGLVVVEKEG